MADPSVASVTDSGAVRLVRGSLALAPDRMPALANLLRMIAEQLGCFGAVLWELSPGSEPKAERPTGRLFVLASWFNSSDRFAIHDLPVSNSLPGRVVRSGQGEVATFPEGALKEANYRVFQVNSVHSMASAPVTFREGNVGALSVYRNDGRHLDRADAQSLGEVAELVPVLYQAIRDRISYRLVEQVDQVLREADIHEAVRPQGPDAQGKPETTLAQPMSKSKMLEVLQRVCVLMAHAFGCREVSLYLEDWLNAPGEFALAATTLAPRPTLKHTYRAGHEHGLTGWLLQNARPVWLLDLTHYLRDRKWIQLEYPGLNWLDNLQLGAVAREELRLKPGERTPPLSVLAAPIQSGSYIVGAVRCSIAEGPYYFSSRDLDLLQIIAAQLAQCWVSWMRHRQLYEENRSLTQTLDNAGGLHDFALSEFSKEKPDETRIFEQVMRLIGVAIPIADLMSVRLLDRKKNELYFAKLAGRRWDERDWPRCRSLRFKLDDLGQSSAAAQVMRTGMPYEVADTAKDAYYVPIFTWVKRKLVVPILSGSDRPSGVLDVRSASARPFLPHEVNLIRLFVRQLGIYHRLAESIGQFRRDKARQLENLADISHQLHGPTTQALYRSEKVVRLFGPRNVDLLGPGDIEIYRVRGLCRKAMSIAESMGLIARLTNDEPLTLDLKSLDPGALRKKLIEAAQDSELMVHPARNLKFKVVREAFGDDAFRGLRVDNDLFEQAIHCLFDNAAKYSYENTIVLIHGGPVEPEGFQLVVRNYGIPISAQEVPRCVERNWRSPAARRNTQDGSGIGLWIVDKIMEAHDGRLEIVPTTADHATEFKLVFPTGKP